MLINQVAEHVAASPQLTPEVLLLAKRHGFSDAQISELSGMPEAVVRGVRHALGVRLLLGRALTLAPVEARAGAVQRSERLLEGFGEVAADCHGLADALHVVVKVPRFAFEKFPAADPTLTLSLIHI